MLVGVGTASQRLDDPAVAKEAVALMADACEAAGADCGAPDLLRAAGLVLVPRGSWRYHDPARLLATALGAAAARTLVAELGVLQTTLVERACTAIAGGQLDVAIVAGGEARWRELRATITGAVAPSTDDAGAEADEVLRPAGMIVSPAEVAAGQRNAVSHYALIENARRRADGQGVEEHRREIAGLWAGFNAVAQGNPAAWNREPMTAEDISRPGPRNRPLAWPYLKWHNSQWNVDQAAALILCSAEAASAAGVPTERWVFPHCVAWSDHMVPLTERVEMHRSPGFRLAFGALGVGVDDIAHVDLYSCFPIAVRTQALELGLTADRPWTVTGGMTFAGGPLNNYVLQSTAKMAQVLRDDPAGLGLVTAISGMSTKQGATLWSTRPAPAGYRAVDVTPGAARTPTVVVDDGASGPATVATYTVLSDESGPGRSVVVADLPGGSRAIATSRDVDLSDAEWCGRPVILDGDGGFVVPA